LLAKAWYNVDTMKLTSTAFENNQSIPSKYTCDAEDINPPLAISDVPEGAQSLVLIMDDPDIPDFVKKSRGIEVFDHWIVFNIPPNTTEITEATEPQSTGGVNSTGKTGYTGPCPPDREHRYLFKLYAIDTMLELDSGATKTDVEQAMQGHILEQTQLVGLYQRINP